MDQSKFDIANSSFQLSTNLSKKQLSLQRKVQTLEQRIEDLECKLDSVLGNAGLSQFMHVMPDISNFTGSNSIRFNLWELEFRHKLEPGGRAIGDSENQFLYVLRHLSSEIQATLQPQRAAACSSGNYDFNDILDVLRDKYSPSRVYLKPKIRKPEACKPMALKTQALMKAPRKAARSSGNHDSNDLLIVLRGKYSSLRVHSKLKARKPEDQNVEDMDMSDFYEEDSE